MIMKTKSSNGFLPTVLAVAAILFLSLTSKGQNASSPTLTNRQKLRVLALALADCPENSKTCNKTFGAAQIATWLTNEAWRAEGRQGTGNLNFADFTALSRVYGNALAKLEHVDLGRYSYDQWILDIGSKGKYVILDNWHAYGQEMAIDTFADILAKWMGDDNGNVTVGQFVDFMSSRQGK